MDAKQRGQGHPGEVADGEGCGQPKGHRLVRHSGVRRHGLSLPLPAMAAGPNPASVRDLAHGGGRACRSGNIVVVTVLVDEAVWPWRGARWAHLVSDESVAELHAFAERLGLRRMAFQGDHYDVPADVRERALALGAEAVRGRDLVRRLRTAGLRLGRGERPGRWAEVWRGVPNGARPEPGAAVPESLATALTEVEADWESAEVVAYRRSFGGVGEAIVVVEDAVGVSAPDPFPAGDGYVQAWRHDDRRVELLVRTPAVLQ